MLDFITRRGKKTKADKEVDAAVGGVKPDGAKEAAPDAAPQDTAQLPVRRQTHHHPGHGHGHHHDAGGSSQAPANPVLNAEDEAFLQSILDAEDAPPPPLPPRVNHDWSSDTEDASAAASLNERQTKDAAIQRAETAPALEGAKKDKKPNRLSLLFTRHKKPEDGLKPEGTVSPTEADKEKKDLGRVLDRLNLSAKNNTVVSMSGDTSDALQRFTQVFKDLVNGVPTAYDDLTKLFEDRDGALNKGFEKLPSSLQKLVTQLPEKLTGSIAPELLAAAAESQGLKAEDASGFNAKTTAEKVLLTKKIMELVTKPGAIVSMLRAIVETLKVRWPAFIGMNVIWSVALTLLMLMLWYCHKRGREERLEREASENVVDGSDRIEELPDDPALPAPKPEDRGTTRGIIESPTSPVSAPHANLPRPPVGDDAPSEIRSP